MAERKKLQNKLQRRGEQGKVASARSLCQQLIFTPCHCSGHAGHPRSTFPSSMPQKTHGLRAHLQRAMAALPFNWEIFPTKSLDGTASQHFISTVQAILWERDSASLPCPCLFPVQARRQNHTGSPWLSTARYLPQIF